MCAFIRLFYIISLKKTSVLIVRVHINLTTAPRAMFDFMKRRVDVCFTK